MMRDRTVVCVLKRLSAEEFGEPLTIWSDEHTSTRPWDEWRVCLKYLAPNIHNADNYGAYVPIGYLIPLEDDDE
jgi:hypothetical protein